MSTVQEDVAAFLRDMELQDQLNALDLDAIDAAMQAEMQPGLLEVLGNTLGGVARTAALPITFPLSRVIGGGFAEKVDKDITAIPAIASGLTAGAVFEPVAALLQLPGEIGSARSGREPDDPLYRVGERVRLAGREAAAHGRMVAMAHGLSEEEAQEASATGGVVGFGSTVFAAWKAAGFALRTGSAAPGFIMQDMTAAALLGGALTEGDLQDRSTRAAREAVIAGGANIILLGSLTAVMQLRRTRVAQKLRADGVLESPVANLDYDPQAGTLRMARMDRREGRAVYEAMSEEQYVTGSERATQLLVQGRQEAAVIQGITDLSAETATHGVVRGMLAPDLSLPKLAEAFPDVKFGYVKRADDTYDVVFGKKSLTPAQMGQFKRERFFEGQVVQAGGSRYEYVGMAKTNAKVRNPVTGKVYRLKPEVLGDTVQARIPIEVRPVLLDDFWRFYKEKMRAVGLAHPELTESQLIEAVRRGEMPVNPDASRVRGVGDSIIYPEELGMGSKFANASNEELAAAVQQAEAAAQQAGFREIPQELLELQQIQKNRELWRQHIIGTGRENTQILGDEVILPFEDIARAYVTEHKITGIDVDEFVAGAAQDVRKRIWASLDESDRVVLQGLEDEYMSILNQADGFGVEHAAAVRGFRVLRESDGSVTLRDTANGTSANFVSEDAARHALAGVDRLDVDASMHSMLPSDAVTGVPPSLGGDLPDGGFYYPDDVPTLQSRGLIPAVRITSNLRDSMERVERATGLPMFTRIFDPIDEGIQRMNIALSVDERLMRAAFSKLRHSQRVQIADFWQRSFGLSQPEKIKVAREMGLSRAQLTAATRARKLWNRGGLDIGMPGEAFIDEYFGRIRPWIEKNNVPLTREAFESIYGGLDNVPTEIRQFYDVVRGGEISAMERDPLLVMAKYFRTIRFNQNVGRPWGELRRLTNVDNPFGINTPGFDPVLRKKIIDAFDGTDNLETFTNGLRNWSSRIRGLPDLEVQNMRGFSKRFFKLLGMKADDQVTEQAINLFMANMYGATIGLAPKMFARNLTQNIWFSYTRFGPTHGSASLRRAMEKEGYTEAFNALAIRSSARGQGVGDAAFEGFVNRTPLEGQNLMGHAFAAVGNAMFRAGKATRRVSSGMMAPFASTDDFNRVWAYWWQKMHAEDVLKKFNAGDISEQRMIDEAMPLYSITHKNEFLRRLKHFGEEDSLQWLGKQASDENHFIYGLSAQPTMLQGSFTRLGATFFTWPLWAKEMYIGRALKNATPVESAKFYGRTAAVGGAIGLIGHEAGVDMWNWMAPVSVSTWFGAPIYDFVYDLKQIASGQDRQGAFNRILSEIPDMTIPGRRAFRDFTAPFEFTDDPAEAAMMIYLGRPDRNSINVFDKIVEQSPIRATLFQNPERPSAVAYDILTRGGDALGLSSGESRRP